jgi:hypothetical protein
MLLDALTIDREAFEAGTGWKLTGEGACRGDVCIPLAEPPGDVVDVVGLADRMGLPLVHDAERGLWALGPWSGSNRTILSAEAPDLELPTIEGQPFRLASLRGQKVLLVAWAPY